MLQPDVSAARARLETAHNQLAQYQARVKQRGWIGLPQSVLAHLGRLHERVAQRAAELRREEARERMAVR